MSKKATFFCENCQTEVNENAKFCPKCGRFFSAVRCPKCGKTGSTSMFTHGCPQCGYAVDKATVNGGRKLNKKYGLFFKSPIKKVKNFTGNFMQKKYSSKNQDSLPIWIYAVSLGLALIFAAVVFGIYL
ncbi:MAG: zinc ribbon domain-containing protein [Treponemataceae bacterium]